MTRIAVSSFLVALVFAAAFARSRHRELPSAPPMPSPQPAARPSEARIAFAKRPGADRRVCEARLQASGAFAERGDFEGAAREAQEAFLAAEDGADAARALHASAEAVKRLSMKENWYVGDGANRVANLLELAEAFDPANSAVQLALLTGATAIAKGSVSWHVEEGGRDPDRGSRMSADAAHDRLSFRLAAASLVVPDAKELQDARAVFQRTSDYLRRWPVPPYALPESRFQNEAKAEEILTSLDKMLRQGSGPVARIARDALAAAATPRQYARALCAQAAVRLRERLPEEADEALRTAVYVDPSCLEAHRARVRRDLDVLSQETLRDPKEQHAFLRAVASHLVDYRAAIARAGGSELDDIDLKSAQERLAGAQLHAAFLPR